MTSRTPARGSIQHDSRGAYGVRESCWRDSHLLLGDPPEGLKPSPTHFNPKSLFVTYD